MGIYGTLEYERLGDLCAEAFTDQEVGRRVIVNEEPMTVAGENGTKSVHPERGHVSIMLPVDGYHAVGMFLAASDIDRGGDELGRNMDLLAMRAKDRAQGRHRRLNAGETVQERYDRLGAEKPGGYGTAGGSSGDHMLALREAIERGEGHKVYPT